MSICSKFFKRLIYNEMHNFFTENNLTSPNQSGFSSGDSLCQLITYYYAWHL